MLGHILNTIFGGLLVGAILCGAPKKKRSKPHVEARGDPDRNMSRHEFLEAYKKARGNLRKM